MITSLKNLCCLRSRQLTDQVETEPPAQQEKGSWFGANAVSENKEVNSLASDPSPKSLNLTLGLPIDRSVDSVEVNEIIEVPANSNNKNVLKDRKHSLPRRQTN